MNAHGTCQLGDTGDRQFHFFAGGHDQVAKLVDDYNDIRQITMPLLGVQMALDKFLVIFLDVMGVSCLQ